MGKNLPLCVCTLYTGNEFNLSKLAEQFNIKKPTQRIINTQRIIKTPIKMKSSNKIEDIIQKGFYEGNRNNFLFAMGFKMVYQDRTKIATLEEDLTQINNSRSNGLTDYEVRKIAESISKLEPTMFQPKRKAVRGKLSNEMWKKGIHGLRNRRSYAGFKTSLNRSIKSAISITDSLIQLFEKGIVKPTNKQVIRINKYFY